MPPKSKTLTAAKCLPVRFSPIPMGRDNLSRCSSDDSSSSSSCGSEVLRLAAPTPVVEPKPAETSAVPSCAAPKRAGRTAAPVAVMAGDFSSHVNRDGSPSFGSLGCPPFEPVRVSIEGPDACDPRNMCQTEYGVVDTPNGSFMACLRAVKDRRLYAKKEDIVLEFGLNVESLYESTKATVTARACPELEVGDMKVSSPDFPKKKFGPWIEDALKIVSTYHRAFTGPDREDLMFDHLVAGLVKVDDSRMRPKIESASHGAQFLDKVDNLKREVGYTTKMRNDANLESLLRWNPHGGDDLYASFSDFLDRYHRVEHRIILGNESIILSKLRKFTMRNRAVFNFTYGTSTIYINPSRSVISHPPVGGEIDHVRLLCMIYFALEDFRFVYGTEVINQPISATKRERDNDDNLDDADTNNRGRRPRRGKQFRGPETNNNFRSRDTRTNSGPPNPLHHEPNRDGPTLGIQSTAPSFGGNHVPARTRALASARTAINLTTASD